MPDSLNLVRNPTLTDGTRRPRSWQWFADGDGVGWSLCDATDDAQRAAIIRSDTEAGTGWWTQRVRCAADQWYRIEARVTSDCRSDDAHGGAALRVRPMIGRKPGSGPVRLAVVLRTAGPETLRSFFRTPAGATSLEVQVGLCRARGAMTLHSVLMVPTLEPEVTSHPLALPPPPYAYAAPRRVRRLCVFGDEAAAERLLSVLGKRYGPKAVLHRRPSDGLLDSIEADALIVAGSRPPNGVRSLSALMRLATGRLVIVSLDAFARIAGRGLRVRTIEQPDDPICARVRWADFITRGFALEDVFPWASGADDPRVYRQRHLVRGAALKAVCARHALETVMESVTDSDATTGHPICLHRAEPGGGLIVCDTDPIGAIPTTADESNIAAFVLFNMLGADQVSLGQYIVPPASPTKWNALLKEFTQRYPMFSLSGNQRARPMIRLGAGSQWSDADASVRPWLLIRTGVGGDDPAGTYGTLLYLKQLVRPEPYPTPYARALAGKYRLAWLPSSAAWTGCKRDVSRAAGPPDSGCMADHDAVKAVIDVTASATRELRVIYAREGRAVSRHALELAELAASFSAGRYFYRSVKRGCARGRRDTMSWQMEKLVPRVTVDARPFETAFHRDADARGAELIRIEIPDDPASFVCNSIWRTELAATTLEHVIGLQYGLLAMNRRGQRVRHGRYRPLNPGEALQIDGAEDPGLRAVRAG